MDHLLTLTSNTSKAPAFKDPLLSTMSLEDPNYGPYTRGIIKVTSGGVALLIGGAQEVIFNRSLTIPSLFGIAEPGEWVSAWNPQFVIASTAAGLLRLPSAYALTESVIKRIRQNPSFSALFPPDQEGKTNVAYGAFIIGGLIVFAGKPGFTFAEPNLTNPLPVDHPNVLTVFLGVPWFAFNVARSYLVLDQSWAFLMNTQRIYAQKLRDMYYESEPTETEEEEFRRTTREQFASGLRKLIQEKAQEEEQDEDQDETQSALDVLYEQIRRVKLTFKERTQSLGIQIQDLKSLVQTSSDHDKDQNTTNLKNAEDALKRLRYLETLLLLKTLKEFDFDQTYAFKDKGWVQNHPEWFYGVKASAGVLGGMATGAIWYGWWYVLGSLDAYIQGHHGQGNDDDPFMGDSVGLAFGASIITAFYAPYVIYACVENVADIVSTAVGYNATLGEQTIQSTTVTNYRRAALDKTFKALSGTYLSFPVGLVGGEGMAEAEVSLGTQWATLAPNLAASGLGPELSGIRAVGASGDDTWAPFFEEGLPRNAKKQALATLYGIFDQWVWKLAPKSVKQLQTDLTETLEALLAQVSSPHNEADGKASGGATSPGKGSPTSSTGLREAGSNSSSSQEGSPPTHKKPGKRPHAKEESSSSGASVLSSADSLKERLLPEGSSSKTRGGLLQKLKNLKDRLLGSSEEEDTSQEDDEL